MDGRHTAGTFRRHSRFMEPDTLALQPGDVQCRSDRMVLQRVLLSGLLADIFAGKRPHVAQDVSKKDRRQPIVKLSIAGQAPDSGVATRTVKIKLDVSDAPSDKENPQGAGAQDLRLFRNGSPVKVWHGDVLKGQSSVSLEEEITVTAGPNRLVAYAFNRDNVKSKDAPLVFNGADTLKRKGTAYIIAVGVNEYENQQYNLKYAKADAQSFA